MQRGRQEKVARESAKSRKIQFVYFMPMESKFFTLNRVSQYTPKLLDARLMPNTVPTAVAI